MLYYSGNGAPLLPDLSSKLANAGLRPIFTLIVFIMYIIITAIIVGIIRLIWYLKNLKQKTSLGN